MDTFVKNLEIKRTYSTAKDDDVVADFYNPVLSRSVKYDRAVGYFSSQALLLYIGGLEQFVNNGGKMRLVMSPFLSEIDEKAFIDAKDGNVHDATASLFNSYRVIKETTIASQLLVALIKEGYLEVKFVVPNNIKGLYHDKIGLFEDGLGLQLAIRGSNNETAAAISANLESFNAFCTWKGDQRDYVDDIVEGFDDIWMGYDNGNYKTLTLAEAVDGDVISSLETDRTSTELFKQLRDETRTDAESKDETWHLTFKPYDYQQQAADKWIAEQRGIIAFATGTGKTKTALLCMHNYFRRMGDGLVVICVPDKTLNNQWADELRGMDIEVVQCFSENSKWSSELVELGETFRYQGQKRAAVVVTRQTMQTNRYQTLIEDFDDYMFIADECHHMGTNAALNVMPKCEYRLGLSATPFVYGSEDLTNRLQRYFGGVIAEYPLAQAIADGRLTKYLYHPEVVGLTDVESENYGKISKQIALYEANKANHKLSDAEQQQEEMLLFKRARIVYGASEKMGAVQNLVNRPGMLDHLLIYCGVTSAEEVNKNTDGQFDENQLTTVNKYLSESNLIYAQYTKEEDGRERQSRIADFRDGTVDVLTAIRCLDEGVDIPEIRTAIIMASSGNPREFVQRRGRLLRLYPGKDIVNIYDLVVLGDEESLNAAELKRVREFASCAENSEEINERFEDQFETYLGEENEE